MVLCGAVLLLSYTHFWLELPLNYDWLLGTMVALLVLNAAAGWRLSRPWPVSDTEFSVQLVIDIAALTLVLYWSGGATNPFVSFYLVPVSIAAALLRPRYTTLLTLLALGLYTLLLFFYQPLPDLERHRHGALSLSSHVFGMWFNFGVSALLITYIIIRMATALREQGEELNRKREQALHNEQLLAVATLAAGTAHELGTPLTTMTVLLEEMPRDNPDTAADLELLEQQVTQCRRILRELVTTAEAHQTRRYAPQPVDTLLKQIIDRWLLLRPGSEYRLEIAGTGDAPAIAADDALRQAIVVLLNNAADTHSGPVEITLDWNHRWIELRVRDHGPGIDLTLASQLGKPFVSSKRGKGMGLGLFLSHATIERYHGTIQLISLEEGGTEATVRLPRIAADASSPIDR